MTVTTWLEALTEHVMIHYRWVFVMFLLPASLLYDLLFYLRSKIIFKLNSAPGDHLNKVATVQRQVRAWRDANTTIPMCTARPGWQTISPQNMNYKKRMHQIEIQLVDVLEVDVDRRTVRCQPLVTMGQLTQTLQPLGWTLPILPELDDLTVGGLVMGTGIETSSHIYGLFQHICKKYELVLPDGSLTTCSDQDNPDLFYAVPWSYGTLGFLVSVEISIIPSKPFIKVDYLPAKTRRDALQIFEAEVNRGNEFVECLLFNEEEAVVMTGNMTDDATCAEWNPIGVWYKPWFFKHVQTFLTKGKGTEIIPIRNYYHRHSRSIFWELQDIIPFGNNLMFRLLFGWLVPPKVSLLKLTQGKTIKKLYEEHHMIQDMLVPMKNLETSLEFIESEVRIFPVWLCPFKLPDNPGMLRPNSQEEEMYVDIGIYGVPTTTTFHTRATSRRIERFVAEHRGYQMLYADSYMTREEFEEMFHLELYDRVRAKYGCASAFPHVYDKINKSARSE